MSGRGNVQKSPSSKAAAIWTRGAYSQNVSTAKGRERRWRLFSTFPVFKNLRLSWRQVLGFFKIKVSNHHKEIYM